jgi:glutathionylspermidine synthase
MTKQINRRDQNPLRLLEFNAKTALTATEAHRSKAQCLEQQLNVEHACSGLNNNNNNHNNNNNNIIIMQFFSYLHADLNSHWLFTESKLVQTTAIDQRMM